MTDRASADMREQVRAYYAEAAQAILSHRPGASASCGSTDRGSCCCPAGTTSCCGSAGTTSCCCPAGTTSCCCPAGTTSCCCPAGTTPCCCPETGSCCGTGSAALDRVGAFGPLYGVGESDGLPQKAVLASLGCGNPLAVADLREGERVLDLGSGGGIDVLLAARRVGPTGFAYGVDMTDDMLALARANAASAGATNVEFRKGEIESVPLPDAAVDVVISNCVINLSTDKPAVLAEMFRVLVPGGRVGICDVVAEDHIAEADRSGLGSYVGCIAGALSRSEYLAGLAAAGFADASVTFTHEAAPGIRSAMVRAVKPE
jgi:arsenite methyltransferase